MDSIYAAIMGVVEGLTEFLPISSTGHLILADHLLGFNKLVGEDFANAFEVIIQLGAILAIVAAYPHRFLGLLNFREEKGFSGLHGISLLVITSIPAALLGFATEKYIDKYLFSPITVAAALAVGAVWILVVEWFRPKAKKEGVDSLTWKEALVGGNVSMPVALAGHVAGRIDDPGRHDIRRWNAKRPPNTPFSRPCRL